MKNPLLICCLLPVLAFAQSGEAPSDMAAAEQLAAILEQTRTLRSEVSVLTLDQDGREVQESTAQLIMQKPDQFYWEILSPYSELMVTDGDVIWRFEPDLEQVTVEPFNNDIRRTPAMLLNGDAADIVDAYTISAGSLDAAGSTDKTRFILYPKGNDSLFTRLSLTFNGAVLEEMQFEDSLGQKTSLVFSDVEANTAIDPATFTFTIPADVEVIDNTR